MSPPKQDAFADLFKSASTKHPSKLSQKLPLNERQKQQVSSDTNADDKIWSSFENLSVGGGHSGSSSQGSRPIGTPVHGSQQDLDDLFSVFDKKEEVAEPSRVSHHQEAVHRSNSGALGSSAASRTENSALLLDDDFVDAFPQQTSTKQTQQTTDSREQRSSVPQKGYSEIIQNSGLHDDEKDEVLAGLVDIGFSVDDSNRAIKHAGPDLQRCVNYLMKGLKNEQPSQKRQEAPRNSHDILNGSFNEFSNEFLSKATSLFNKSKDTMMRNLEQFQQKQQGGEEANLPAWMKTQSHYKSDAIERRNNGTAFEDYGSDEENIDEQSIRKFMIQQKDKERERQKLRYDSIKNAALNKVSSGRTSPVKQQDLPKRPTSQPQFTAAEPKKKEQISVSQPKPQTAPQDADLLGISSSNTKASQINIPSRSNTGSLISTDSTSKQKKNISSEPLNEFLQSDYDTSKARATELFASGDYDGSYNHYLKCLNALPSNHELRIVIYSNLTLTLCKIGNFKEARDLSAEGLKMLKEEELNDTSITIGDRSLKSWYTKLLSRKAESLEMLEAFAESLECYMELIKLGVNDKKIMDGKRRVNKIVNPPPKPVKTSRPPDAAQKPTSVASKATQATHSQTLKDFKSRDAKEKRQESERAQLQESVDAKLSEWSRGNEENIRALLTTLPSVLPQRLGFPFLTTKPIGLGDIMLPKKVKIAYMKVISSIHPDKLGSMATDDKMLCQGVFIVLNKSWDTFKDQNGLT